MRGVTREVGVVSSLSFTREGGVLSLFSAYKTCIAVSIYNHIQKAQR